MIRYKCPECGGRTTTRLKIKEEGPAIAGPCKECLRKEAERTHEVIADLAREAGKK
jgi:hypothetical protein